MLPSESLLARGYVPGPINTGAPTNFGTAGLLFESASSIGAAEEIVKRMALIRLIRATAGKNIVVVRGAKGRRL